MIELIEKSNDDASAWLVQLWKSYYQDLLAAGMTKEQADRNVERNREQLVKDGRLAPGQRVFDVVNDGSQVGVLWLGHQPDQSPGEWFIYDIEIDEDVRGTGLGRATMLAAEAFVTSQAGTRLGLNVFGNNTVARRLYESLDYRTLSLSMYKDLA